MNLWGLTSEIRPGVGTPIYGLVWVCRPEERKCGFSLKPRVIVQKSKVKASYFAHFGRKFSVKQVCLQILWEAHPTPSPEYRNYNIGGGGVSWPIEG